jgi:hypothetical protein
MRSRWLLAIALAALLALTVAPAGALGGDEGDDAPPPPAPIPAVPKANPETVLSEVEALAGTSIASATNDPDNPYAPFPETRTFGPDGTAATEEGSTTLTNGALESQIVLSTLDARTVATVTAKICPDADGIVTAHITVNVGAVTGDDRVIEANARGVSNDNAELTSPTVTVTSGRGAEARLLERTGKAILRQAEQAWRNGYCVKVEVREGGSRVVKPREKVPISAIATPRFGGGEIRGRMEAKKTAGKTKVEPARVSASPAKFTYTGPPRRPGTGSVELKSVSRRGIGIANLEYTTEGDLKIEAGIGPAVLKTVKCGGPVGAWDIAETISVGPVSGTEHFTFTLTQESLTGPVVAAGDAMAPGAATDTGNRGTATYVEAADGKSGTLTITPGGSVPVTIGLFCTNGVPPPG